MLQALLNLLQDRKHLSNVRCEVGVRGRNGYHISYEFSAWHEQTVFGINHTPLSHFGSKPTVRCEPFQTSTQECAILRLNQVTIIINRWSYPPLAVLLAAKYEVFRMDENTLNPIIRPVSLVSSLHHRVPAWIFSLPGWRFKVLALFP